MADGLESFEEEKIFATFWNFTLNDDFDAVTSAGLIIAIADPLSVRTGFDIVAPAVGDL
jgi:hypothetical protein